MSATVIDFNDWGPKYESDTPPEIAFLEFIRQKGLDPDCQIIADGVFHRERDRRDKAGKNDLWYILFSDGVPCGEFGHWKYLPDGVKWSGKSEISLTPGERENWRYRMDQARKERAQAEAERRAECREKSAELWEKAREDVDLDHPYLVKKGVESHGLRQLRNLLLIPVQDIAGTLHGLQFIMPDGSKKFKTGTAITGCFHRLGEPRGKIYLAEGYATGATVHQVTGHAVAVGFDCGNLQAVAVALRAAFPAVQIIVCSDDDHAIDGNPGLTKAKEAARAVNGLVAIPSFPETRGPKDTDFNDLARVAGPEAVKKCIESALDRMSYETPFDLSRLKTGAEILAGDYHFNYVWEKMIPEGAIILFYGQGGTGKSTLVRQIADAVSKGAPLMGLRTSKRKVVVVDYENPMAVLKKGISAVGPDSDVYYWTITDEPPQLDSPEWEQLKALVGTLGNPLLIFDTLQSAAFTLDIASNEDYSPVMNRFKQLRELGATIILLLHTIKSDATKYVGASVIFNQVDHVLAMYSIKPDGTYKEPAADDPDILYRFGSKDKTRYGHHSLHVVFNKEICLFQLASAPDVEEMKILQHIVSEVNKDTACNMKWIIEALENQECLLDISEKNIRRLLKKGDGVYWQSRKGVHNMTLYDPLELSFSSTCEEKDQQSPVNTEFGSFPDPLCQTAKPHEQGHHDNENESRRILSVLGAGNDRFYAEIE